MLRYSELPQDGPALVRRVRSAVTGFNGVSRGRAPSAGIASTGHPSPLVEERGRGSLVLLAAVILVIAFVHVWQLGAVPRGLYLDESSIGLNAALIAESGVDEHGVPMPVYFEAFPGEYKNPVFIYTTALIFKLFGVSIEALRATSAVYFAVFMAGAILLIRLLFPGNRLVLIYVVLAAGTLPWVFTLSRIAFEVISQVAVVTWALLAVRHAYKSGEETGGRRWAVLAGALLGLSVYSYSTARLLTPLLIALVLLIWRERRYWRRHVAMLGAFLVVMFPFVGFSIAEPGALTRRFSEISYFSKNLSMAEYAARFAEGYVSYFSPGFLLFQGDAARDGGLRHHTGFGGELQVVTFALAMVGLLVVSRRLGAGRDRFPVLLLSGLLISPIAGSLTSTSPHALRGLLLGLFVLLLSAYGMAAITALKRPLTRGLAVGMVALALVTQASAYLWDYFDAYPDRSMTAFGSYGLKEGMRLAYEQAPGEIVGYGYRNYYAHLAFTSV